MINKNGEVREMRDGATVLEIIRDYTATTVSAGEPDALNGARPVRRGTDGKGPRKDLAGGPTRGHGGFGERPADTGQWHHSHRAAGRLNQTEFGRAKCSARTRGTWVGEVGGGPPRSVATINR